MSAVITDAREHRATRHGWQGSAHSPSCLALRIQKLSCAPPLLTLTFSLSLLRMPTVMSQAGRRHHRLGHPFLLCAHCGLSDLLHPSVALSSWASSTFPLHRHPACGLLPVVSTLHGCAHSRSLPHCKLRLVLSLVVFISYADTLQRTPVRPTAGTMRALVMHCPGLRRKLSPYTLQ